MGNSSQPPGFCFHPTDEELFTHYLKRKVYGRPQPCSVISEADPYECEPWDLPDNSCLKGRNLKGYFFSPKKAEYPIGSRKVRATKLGYWKVTRKDRTIVASSEVLGIKKTLVFYRGRVRHGERTNWRMHEYILDDCNDSNSNTMQQSYVLCKVFQKNISRRCKHCSASSSQVNKTEYPDGEHGEMASLNIQNVTQATNDFKTPNGMLLGQGSVLNDVLALRGHSEVPDNDEFHTFLMTHIGDPDDPQLDKEENGPMEQAAFANQPQQFIDTNLENVTSGDEQNHMQDGIKDDVDNLHFQDTMIPEEDKSKFCSSLSAQHDLSLDILDGDFIELNDLITPLEVDSLSSEFE